MNIFSPEVRFLGSEASMLTATRPETLPTSTPVLPIETAPRTLSCLP